jgi:hypothetical protein
MKKTARQQCLADNADVDNRDRAGLHGAQSDGKSRGNQVPRREDA